MVIFVWS